MGRPDILVLVILSFAVNMHALPTGDESAMGTYMVKVFSLDGQCELVGYSPNRH